MADGRRCAAHGHIDFLSGDDPILAWLRGRSWRSPVLRDILVDRCTVSIPAGAVFDQEAPMKRHANRLLLTLDRATSSGRAEGAPLGYLSPCAKMPDLGVGMHAAIILEAHGYATLERSTRLEENRLQITGAGVAEADRLRL